MKKSILILALILFGFVANAMVGEKNLSYVKTGNEVYFGQDLKMGLFNFKVIDSEGTVTKIPNRDVVAYTHNSRTYEYLPVMCKTNGIECYAMMELIKVKSGLNLYRYTGFDGRNQKYEYFIFKNGEFHLRIDQQNAKTVLPFFGIKVV